MAWFVDLERWKPFRSRLKTGISERGMTWIKQGMIWSGVGTRFMFLRPQACEKILKAYFRSKGIIVRTHRIEEWLLLAKDQGLSVDDLAR